MYSLPKTNNKNGSSPPPRSLYPMPCSFSMALTLKVSPDNTHEGFQTVMTSKYSLSVMTSLAYLCVLCVRTDFLFINTDKLLPFIGGLV